MARVNYYALLTTKIDAELANLHHLKGLAAMFLQKKETIFDSLQLP